MPAPPLPLQNLVETGFRAMDRGDREAVWIIASKAASGEQISAIFSEANFSNPLRVFCAASHLAACIGGDPREVTSIVVVDLDVAPEESGRVLNLLGSRSGLRNVPVLAVISRENENRLDRAYDLGVRSYLFKPFTFGQFLERARLLNVQFIIGPGNG